MANTMEYADAVAVIINDMGAEIDRLRAALEAADLYLNNYDTSKPSRIKAELRATVAEALATR